MDKFVIQYNEDVYQVQPCNEGFIVTFGNGRKYLLEYAPAEDHANAFFFHNPVLTQEFADGLVEEIKRYKNNEVQ